MATVILFIYIYYITVTLSLQFKTVILSTSPLMLTMLFSLPSLTCIYNK